MKRICFFIAIAFSCWKLAAIPMEERGILSERKNRDLRNNTAITFSSDNETQTFVGGAPLSQLSFKENEDIEDNSFTGDGIIQAEEQNEIVRKLLSLMPLLGVNNANLENPHWCFKELQQHRAPISYKEQSIIWDNENWRFEKQETANANPILDQELQDVLETLNAYVSYETEAKRLDHYCVDEQDPNEPQLLAELRSPIKNRNCSPLKIAHQNGEETFKVLSKTSASNDSKGPCSILLFGFDVPNQKGPRIEIEKKLIDENKFQGIVLQTINNLNASLGIKMMKQPFQSYLDFIVRAKKKDLAQQASQTMSQQATQVTAWAAFLEKNLGNFDFSNKMTSLEKKARFFVKNYKEPKAKKLNGINLHDDPKNLASICGYLEPALALLEKAGTELIVPILDNASLDEKKLELMERYNFSLPTVRTLERRQDLQRVLDSIVTEAFFRKTSKLGLEYAKETAMKVAFVWRLPLFPSETSTTTASPETAHPTTLQKLHDYVKKKPYYHLNFREDNGKKFPEAITCSEIDHLTRLKNKSAAPDYLLIRSILPPELTANTASSSSSSSSSGPLSWAQVAAKGVTSTTAAAFGKK